MKRSLVSLAVIGVLLAGAVLCAVKLEQVPRADPLGRSLLYLPSPEILKVISVGNKLNVDELELLEYLIKDPETTIIVLYLESFTDGRKLYEMARTSPKPIIVFKSNISGKPSALALSHTAALASDDRIVDAAFASCGILRAHTFREMILMCKALTLPLIRGPNLVLLASSASCHLIASSAMDKHIQPWTRS